MKLRRLIALALIGGLFGALMAPSLSEAAVVKRITIENAVDNGALCGVSLTELFTPVTEGVFRVNATFEVLYREATLSIYWELADRPGYFGLEQTFQTWAASSVSVIHRAANQPILYKLCSTFYPMTYNLYVVIEKL